MANIVEVGPDNSASTTSLRQIIARAGSRPVHILFVHGIREGDRGSSATFREHMVKRIPGAAFRSSLLGHRVTLPFNPGVTYMGCEVWRTDQAWEASFPFVDRYEYSHDGEGSIIVDEVNWWPLALPLRLQALLLPEAGLAGADREHLKLGAGLDKNGNPLNDGIHFPWIDQTTLTLALAKKPPLGGAAALNGGLKRALMDWGLSDAVIALGPMRRYLHDAMDQAFAYACDRLDAIGPAEFVVVAESLGSFIVFDAYGHGKNSVRSVMDSTSYIYFFANQLGLLELGRLNDPTHRNQLLQGSDQNPLTLHEALKEWGKPSPNDFAPAIKQIIAFSDPSDALTFLVPEIADPKDHCCQLV